MYFCDIMDNEKPDLEGAKKSYTELYKLGYSGIDRKYDETNKTCSDESIDMVKVKEMCTGKFTRTKKYYILGNAVCSDRKIAKLEDCNEREIDRKSACMHTMMASVSMYCMTGELVHIHTILRLKCNRYRPST